MKRIHAVVFVVLLMLISGCGKDEKQPIREEHQRYLADRGWEVKAFLESNTFVLDPPIELLRSYEASRITFIHDYLGQEVTSYAYELKQKDEGGEHVRAILYEAEGRIVGGYGVLPSWTPGRFNLDEKERLVSENKVTP